RAGRPAEQVGDGEGGGGQVRAARAQRADLAGQLLDPRERALPGGEAGTGAVAEPGRLLGDLGLLTSGERLHGRELAGALRWPGVQTFEGGQQPRALEVDPLQAGPDLE